ncbi:hypothetical protein K2173_002317 [Erythroxylum novogranatense]|uniref:Transmembrane protein n=1 Tax=Erythroxylum novogranatense TaxID=1862640 RepID=A0AAV8TAW7_9ROSI|nr:hypothetical protein K2173_002317 [Erythroxylum novogranatense]
MSTPLDQQQQQQAPPVAVVQAYTERGGHGSVGPVIAVLAVITILGVIAGMIGRLCSGRRILGFGEYDLEGWVERKCSSCIDGHVDPPTPPSPDTPVAGPVEEDAPQEMKNEQQETNQHKAQASTSQS